MSRKDDHSKHEVNQTTGKPGAGKGQREQVGPTGVYPQSGPRPDHEVEKRAPGEWVHTGQPSGSEAERQVQRVQAGTATAEELEIRRDTWLSFFDDFSLKHEGQTVDLEVVEPGGTPQAVFRKSPFKSLSVNLAGSEGGSISISAASGPKQLNTHQVGGVEAISLWRNEEGQDEGLDIRCEDGSRAILTLRPSAR